MDIEQFKNKVLLIINNNASLTQQQKDELNAAVEALKTNAAAKKISKSKINF
jgi:hypothetical protein